MLHLTIFYSYMAALFAVANPIGNTAIFIGLTGDKSEQEKKGLAFSASIAITIIWMITVWAGDYVLRFFGISVSAFQLAGH